MKITYLVSGGAGFIGSNLLDALAIDTQARVICLDNLSTSRKSNIDHLLGVSNVTFIRHDITKPIKIDDKIDYVINLACPASPVDYQEIPIETLAVCSQGTQNLLEIARQNNARFIQASTSEVYGDPLEHPQKETYWGNVNSYGERACYDEGKRFAEALIFSYRKKFGLNTGIIRIFNTYGPKMRPYDGRVVSTLIRQALKGEDLTLFGNGQQTRSFCYIDDQIEAQIAMIHSREEGPINIGNPTEFTIAELAEKIIKITNSKSKITFLPIPKDDPTQRKPDITLARELLNWQPKVQLEEGLLRTIAWFQKTDY